MCVQSYIKLLFCLEIKSLNQSKFLRLMMVSVSFSIFDTKDKSFSISLNLWDQFIKSQSQNLIPILKVSFSVSKIETRYTEVSLSLNMQKLVSHISTIAQLKIV